MTPLKVGLVLDDTLDSTDGVQQYILTLGRWLSSVGHDVHFLVGQTERTDIQNVHSLSRNVKVRFNGNRMSMPLPADRAAVRKLLAQEQFDVLHIQMPYSPFMAQRVIAEASSQTAVVGTFHVAPNSTVVGLANRGLSLWTRKSLRRFDTMVSVSEAARQFAQQAFGIETSIVPNIVELEMFRSAVAMPTPDDRPTIVYLGRLVPRKGCADLLNAVSLLPADLPVRVLVCGRGPLEASLRAQVERLQLSGTVEFVGYVSDQDKARYLKSADLAVFPSTGGESFGIVLVEAMGADYPIVLGADNPGYRTVLGGGPDLLFPVHDPSKLAVLLQDYLVDAVKRETALQWQRMHVGQFDVAVVGRHLETIYQDALSRRRNVQ